jgi:hypothetical protein
MALLKGNFIILFLALSFMFDVHPRSISSTGISVRYSVTTADRIVVKGASSAFACGNTSALEGTVLSTGTAAALIEFAELIFVTEFRSSNSTFTAFDLALWCFGGTACSSKIVKAACRQSTIGVARNVRTVSTVICAGRTHSLRDNYLSEVFSNARVIIGVSVCTTDRCKVFGARLACGICIAYSSSRSFSKAFVVVSHHITSADRCIVQRTRSTCWTGTLRAVFSTVGFGNAVIVVGDITIATHWCKNCRARNLSHIIFALSLALDVDFVSIGVTFGAVGDSITAANGLVDRWASDGARRYTSSSEPTELGRRTRTRLVELAKLSRVTEHGRSRSPFTNRRR